MKKEEQAIILTIPQQKIMDIIWTRGGATARSIHKTLSVEKDVSYFSINTMLKTLVKKGLLVHSKVGNVYFYRPLFSRRQVINLHIRQALENYFDSIPEKMIEFVIQNSCGEAEYQATAKQPASPSVVSMKLQA